MLSTAQANTCFLVEVIIINDQHQTRLDKLAKTKQELKKKVITKTSTARPS